MLQRHILPAWKQSFSDSIPWAEPAAAPQVDLPSYKLPNTYKSKFSVRHIKALEVNLYPQNFGEYPAFVPPKTNHVSFDVKHIQALDLDTYPAAIIVENYIAAYKVPTYKAEFQSKAIYPQELNVYPATPQAFYEGYYPGSKLPKTYQWDYKTELRQPQELDQYTATPVAEQPMTAFLPPITRRMEYDVRYISAIPITYVDPAVVVVVPSQPISTRYDIFFSADDRDIIFLHDSREIKL
jgi:hypothetical protein